MIKIKTLLVSILFVLAFWNTSTGQTAEDFHRSSLRNNQTAMWILGSWAAGNMLTGGLGMGRTEGSVKYFHQMNLMWNTVNMGIAAYGLLSQASVSGISMQEAMAAHHKTENLFLLNSGLDLVYMAVGGYMIHRSRSGSSRADLLLGYGRSVLLQGGFLLVFDTAFWLIQRNLRLEWADQITLTAAVDLPGLQVLISF